MVITICNHYHRNLKTVKLFLKELSAIRFASARATTAKNYYYAKKESEIVPPAIIMHFVHLHFSVEEGDDESDGGNDSVPQPLPEAGDDSPDVGGIDGSIGPGAQPARSPIKSRRTITRAALFMASLQPLYWGFAELSGIGDVIFFKDATTMSATALTSIGVSFGL